MTTDQERWAEALAIEELHGERAMVWVINRMTALSLADDDAGVARMREILHRLEQLIGPLIDD